MLETFTKLLKRLNAPTAPATATGLSGDDADLIGRVRAQRLTYLSEKKLVRILGICRSLESNGVPGAFMEAGCALGGSTIAIARAKNRERPLRVYDVFDMIPPPSAEDPPEVHERYKVITSGKSPGIGGDQYYGYQSNLVAKVESNLRDFGFDLDRDHISLIKGLVQDTLVVDGPVAFAHIDVDWYDPVTTCLTRIFPRLSPGGVIVLDDYLAWGGCRRGTDEYLAQVPGQYTADTTSGAMVITRTAP